MQTKKCKYCNKDIHIKAEICPNCGCRVKGNIFKIIVICIISIGALIGTYMGVITIKDKIRYRKIEKAEENEIIRQENVVKTFIGNYKIVSPEYIEVSTYTGEYKKKYNLLESITVHEEKIDYMGVDENYIFYDDANVKPNIYVYEDNSKKIMIIYIKDLVSDEIDSIYNRYVCLELKEDTLEQVKCRNDLLDSVYIELDDFSIKMVKE